MHLYTHIYMSEYLGFCKLNSSAFLFFLERASYICTVTIYLYPHIHMWEHPDFMNCIHNHSSISPRQGSKGTVNNYSHPHTLATWCEALTHWKSTWCWESESRRWSGPQENETTDKEEQQQKRKAAKISTWKEIIKIWGKINEK